MRYSKMTNLASWRLNEILRSDIETGPRWWVIQYSMIKLCCYVIRSTTHPDGSQRPPGWPQFIPWCQRYKIQSMFTRGFDVAYCVQLKIPKPRIILNVTSSWYGIVSSRWLLLDTMVFFLTTASNVNCWADVANHVTRLWQAGNTENFERRIIC